MQYINDQYGKDNEILYRTYSKVQYSTIQYRKIHYYKMQFMTDITVQYNIERYTTMAYIRVHNNTVGLCTMLYNVMYRYSKV